jgi:hypothetical protein
MRTSRANRTIRRLREIGAELDYAQRRVLELRTGVPVGAQERRRSLASPRHPSRRSLDELEAL